MRDRQTADLLEAMKKAATAMKRAGLPFALAGGGAAYARGAAMPTHDIDFVILEEDADAVAKALADSGMRIAHPPEGWLIKAYDGDSMVDLIFKIADEPVTPELLARAEQLEVSAVRMPVLDATDLVLSWLRAFSEHHADFAATLTLVRPVREQADWNKIRRETRDSPFAHAFLTLLEGLRVLPGGRGQMVEVER
jgi:predicted nucleotidyltransferase